MFWGKYAASAAAMTWSLLTLVTYSFEIG